MKKRLTPSEVSALMRDLCIHDNAEPASVCLDRRGESVSEIAERICSHGDAPDDY